MAKWTSETTPRHSSEEAAANGAKGGRKSGQTKRRRKALKELLEIALQMEAEDGQTNAEAITAALINRALSGDVKAYETIRDGVGERPVNQVEVSTNDIKINIIDDSE